MLQAHQDIQAAHTSDMKDDIREIKEIFSGVELVPRSRAWLHMSIWAVSVLFIAYLSFRVSRIEEVRERAFAEGERSVMSGLQKYFDWYPDQYESYRQWKQEVDSIAGKK